MDIYTVSAKVKFNIERIFKYERIWNLLQFDES